MIHELIPRFLDRTKLVYTFTNLNCYVEVCPHQFYRRYLVKDIPFVKTEAMRRGNAVHLAMEKRVRGGVPLPVDMQRWESLVAPVASYGAQVELKLGIRADGSACDFWAQDVWLRGKIDVALVKDDSAAVVDWKTGSSKYERALELRIGALLLNAKYLNLLTKIKGFYVWLAEDRLGTPHDLSDTNATFEELRVIATAIEADRRTNNFVKRPSGLCGWCDVVDCEYNRKAIMPEMLRLRR